MLTVTQTIFETSYTKGSSTCSTSCCFCKGSSSSGNSTTTTTTPLISGGGVMLLVHKDISHMPITELENDSESI